MISHRQAAVLTIAMLAMPAASPRIARAHAFPASESPAVGSTMNRAPAEVAISFDNPIEKLFARLQVLDSAGVAVSAGPLTLSGDRLRLSMALKTLKPGEYTVKWSVVAEDGHRTEGSFNFTIAGSGS